MLTCLGLARPQCPSLGSKVDMSWQQDTWAGWNGGWKTNGKQKEYQSDKYWEEWDDPKWDPVKVDNRKEKVLLNLDNWGLDDTSLRNGLSPKVRERLRDCCARFEPDAEWYYIDVFLSGNQIGPAGVVSLGDFLRDSRQNGVPLYVRELRAYKNSLGDEGILNLVRYMLSQPQPFHELHLSHNGITSLGAMIMLLALGDLHPENVYPFPMPKAPGRYVPCWCRLEHNDIEGASKLVKVLERSGSVRIIETSKDTKEWGPLRSPSHCTVRSRVPQVALHLFNKQNTSQNETVAELEALMHQAKEKVEGLAASEHIMSSLSTSASQNGNESSWIRKDSSGSNLQPASSWIRKDSSGNNLQAPSSWIRKDSSGTSLQASASWTHKDSYKDSLGSSEHGKQDWRPTLGAGAGAPLLTKNAASSSSNFQFRETRDRSNGQWKMANGNVEQSSSSDSCWGDWRKKGETERSYNAQAPADVKDIEQSLKALLEIEKPEPKPIDTSSSKERIEKSLKALLEIDKKEAKPTSKEIENDLRKLFELEKEEPKPKDTLPLAPHKEPAHEPVQKGVSSNGKKQLQESSSAPIDVRSVGVPLTSLLPKKMQAPSPQLSTKKRGFQNAPLAASATPPPLPQDRKADVKKTAQPQPQDDQGDVLMDLLCASLNWLKTQRKNHTDLQKYQEAVGADMISKWKEHIELSSDQHAQAKRLIGMAGKLSESGYLGVDSASYESNDVEEERVEETTHSEVQPERDSDNVTQSNGDAATAMDESEDLGKPVPPRWGFEPQELPPQELPKNVRSPPKVAQLPMSPIAGAGAASGASSEVASPSPSRVPAPEVDPALGVEVPQWYSPKFKIREPKKPEEKQSKKSGAKTGESSTSSPSKKKPEKPPVSDECLLAAAKAASSSTAIDARELVAKASSAASSSSPSGAQLEEPDRPPLTTKELFARCVMPPHLEGMEPDWHTYDFGVGLPQAPHTPWSAEMSPLGTDLPNVARDFHRMYRQWARAEKAKSVLPRQQTPARVDPPGQPAFQTDQYIDQHFTGSMPRMSPQMSSPLRGPPMPPMTNSPQGSLHRSL